MSGTSHCTDNAEATQLSNNATIIVYTVRNIQIAHNNIQKSFNSSKIVKFLFYMKKNQKENAPGLLRIVAENSKSLAVLSNRSVVTTNGIIEETNKRNDKRTKILGGSRSKAI